MTCPCETFAKATSPGEFSGHGSYYVAFAVRDGHYVPVAGPSDVMSLARGMVAALHALTGVKIGEWDSSTDVR